MEPVMTQSGMYNPYLTSEKKSYGANPLRRFKIVIADGDSRMAQVTKSALNKVGFTDIHVTDSSEEAYTLVQSTRPDLLFTDGAMRGSGGMELVRRIRRDPMNTQPILPILFMSGQSEESDVAAARDIGVNEYVRKPFAAQTLCAKLGHVIDKPRQFVVVKGYVGPDRRRHGHRAKVLVERRRSHPMPRRFAGAFTRNPKPQDAALLLTPDTSLREKLGSFGTLRNVITPDKIEQAQNVIESFADEALDWIRADLRQMRIYLHAMQAGEYAPFTSGAFTNRVLEVRCRAGTFGYHVAGDVAYTLYQFCRTHAVAKDPDHQKVIRKHLEILQVITSSYLRGVAVTDGTEIMDELKKLVARFDPYRQVTRMLRIESQEA